MATGTTTSTQIPAPIQLFYDKILLRRALPRIVHNRFGQQRPVDMNNGDQPKFRRYTSLPQATSPLVEGVTPESQQLAKTDITGQLVQYGAYVTLTDYVQMTTQDRILTETAELLGENAGETLDVVYRDALVGGTTVQYSGTATVRTAVVAFITEADMNKMIRTLTTANAKFWNEKPIVGMDRHNTTPIAPAYYAIVHPKTSFTLKGLTNFVQTHKYPDPSNSMDGEIGSYNQLRFIETTQAKSWADGAGGASTAAYFSGTGTATKVDVFGTLVFGRDAYGITPLGGKALENIVKPLGAGEDALNQRGTSGWKATTDLVILNDAFMLRYEHAVSL